MPSILEWQLFFRCVTAHPICMSAPFPTPVPAAADALAPRVPSARERVWALIPCAGIGARAGNGTVPKQYKHLAGQPLVMHTLAAFAGVSRLRGGVVAVAAGDRFFDGRAVSPDGSWSVLPCGGATRAESVANGLQALLAQGADAGDWVMVHDAARCLVTTEQIDRLLDACAPDDVGGLLALPLADTLKTSHGGRVGATVDRAGKWLAQTPQMFRIGVLAHALEAAGPVVTDESSAVEAAGLQPLLVTGSALNFKVTWPEDFALAEAVLEHRKRATTGLPSAE